MRIVEGFSVPDTWVFTDKWIREQIANSADYGRAEQYIRDWGAAIDGGANVGMWSQKMAAKFDVVYAVEPHPDTFEALKENVKHLPNVRCIHAFLGSKAGTAGIEGIGFGCYLKGDGDIPVITIDSLNVKPGFIKLDVEGSESDALMGAHDTLRHRPVVMFEDKHWKRYGGRHPSRYLSGYSEVCRVHKDRIFTHDGR